MGFMEGFALNYNSLAIIEGIILWLITLLTFSTIKQKSPSVKWFLGIMGLGVIFLSGYVFSQGYYVQSPYSRLIILGFIPFQHWATLGFFLHFPSKTHPRLTLGLLSFFFLLISVVVSFVFYKALNADMIYDFSGHFYEYNMPEVFKLYGLTVLLTTLTVQGVSIWRWYSLPSGQKRGYGWFSLAIFLGYTISAVLNLLNKTGVIDRGSYITFFSLMTTFAIFILLVAFINHTEDRTTFLFKIIGASLTTFLVIFGFVTLVILKEKELSYDENKSKEWKSLIQSPDESKDLVFIQRFDPEDGLSFSYQKSGYEPVGRTATFLRKLYLWKKISESNDDIYEDLPGALMEDEVLSFYWKYLFHKSPINDRESLLKEIPNVNRTFYLLYNKLKEIPEDSFETKFLVFLDKERSKMMGADQILENSIENKTMNGKELKAYVMSFFTPIYVHGERSYGLSRDGSLKLIYFYFIGNDGSFYQMGYNYESYRMLIHRSSILLFYLVIFGTILFVAGIPIFLSRALIKPLGKLLVNVGEVRKGNLNVKTPIKVFDEIGYLSQAFNTMVDSIRESERKLKEYAEKLEEKVDERTKELAVTLSEVELLKEQQDGDYFLTTLLLKPFGVQQNSTAKIKLDFFVKQKKEFTFRSRKYQIGGDICLSNRIKLKGQNYIVFLNADAMGKSMQGAGGILVLGSVFQSIIQRTMSYPAHSEISPEKWIKLAFKEMHKIFETFDGSMLISVVFGLVEENNGLVYYINAEHPWLILYRDGVASFIEEKSYFRKLGHAGLKGDLIISTFQLVPGDLLIIGSDGKDDLVIEKTDFARQINEDELLFLKRVEESKGDLAAIYEAIRSRYELIDDFSLLSLHFPEQEVLSWEIERDVLALLQNSKSMIKRSRDFTLVIRNLEKGYEDFQREKRIFELLTWCYIKMQMFKEAAILARDFLKHNDANTETLFRASYCFKKNRDFEEAIELSERVKLREPQNHRNLMHLGDLYAYTKNFRKARKSIQKALLLDPGNEKALQLLDRIESLALAETDSK
jgi:HAMP domain-containing protein